MKQDENNNRHTKQTHSNKYDEFENCTDIIRYIDSECEIPYGTKYAIYLEEMDWEIKTW